MAGNDNSFEERLKRIQQTRGGPTQPAAPLRGGTTTAARRQMPGGLRYVLWSPVIGLAIGAGFFVSAGGLDKMRSLVALDQFVALTSPDAPPAGQPGLFESLFGANKGESAADRDPTSFLPDAPAGWVRVNRLEAQRPDALQTVQAAWPADAVFGLQENLGYAHLTDYLADRQRDDLEERVLSRKRARAIYLNGDGGFVWVTMEFLGDKTALGPADDPSAWIETLAAREQKNLDSDEIVERNRMAGIDITNRTVPAGKSLLKRPIGDNYDIPNGVRIAVPMTDRAILRIDGMAVPRDIEAFIGAINHDDLTARLSN